MFANVMFELTYYGINVTGKLVVLSSSYLLMVVLPPGPRLEKLCGPRRNRGYFARPSLAWRNYTARDE